MDKIYLSGSDDVLRAAQMMQGASTEMVRAASNIESALLRHEQFMEDWLNRFREAADYIGYKLEDGK